MEFRVLGPLEVVEDGRRVPLDRQRLRALLAFLLLHANEAISSDRLIDEVWGPEAPKTASASLQNYVSRLRKVIGTDALLSQPPGYVLRVDPERFDLARFERLTGEARGADPRERAEKLRAALALWRGPALADLAYETKSGGSRRLGWPRSRIASTPSWSSARTATSWPSSKSSSSSTLCASASARSRCAPSTAPGGRRKR
jgi:two-component SAPR family response regulator